MHSMESTETSPDAAPVLLLTDKELAVMNGGWSIGHGSDTHVIQ